MAGPEQERGPGGSSGRYRSKYGPLRLVLPWVAVAVGLLVAVTHVGGIADGSGMGLFVGGIAVAVLGVAAFFVYRWMARRGI